MDQLNRRVKIVFKIASIIAIFSLLSVSIPSMLVVAIECFPKSEAKLPFILSEKDVTSNGEETYESITGCDDFIIAGGHSKSATLSYASGDANGFSVLTRIDLEPFVTRWSRTYRVGGMNSESRYITGLALHRGATIDRVAVFAQYNPKDKGTESKNFIFIVDAADGGHLSKKATYVNLSQ